MVSAGLLVGAGFLVVLLLPTLSGLLPSDTIQGSVASGSTSSGAQQASLRWMDYALLLAVCLPVIVLQFLAGHATITSNPKLARLQLPRRCQHASSGLLITVLYLLLPYHIAVGGLGTGFLAFLLLQLLRSRVPEVQARFLDAFGPLLKENERAGAPPAALWFLGGNLFCFLALPSKLCLATLLAASFGDPAAAVIGTLYGGKKLIGSKTSVGSAACFLVSGACGVLAAVILPSSDSGFTLTAALPCFLLSGYCFAAAELVGGCMGIDDNLFMQVTGSLALWALEGIAGTAR